MALDGFPKLEIPNFFNYKLEDMLEKRILLKQYYKSENGDLIYQGIFESYLYEVSKSGEYICIKASGFLTNYKWITEEEFINTFLDIIDD